MGSAVLRQLAYTSLTRDRVSRTGILDILRTSRAHNVPRGVTGALLYADGAFLQVIEGPPDAVDEVYGRIRQDPRHDRVMTLLDAAVETRAFPEWPMGLLRIGDVSDDVQPSLRAVLERAEQQAGRVWSVVRAYRYVALARRTQPLL